MTFTGILQNLQRTRTRTTTRTRPTAPLLQSFSFPRDLLHHHHHHHQHQARRIHDRRGEVSLTKAPGSLRFRLTKLAPAPSDVPSRPSRPSSPLSSRPFSRPLSRSRPDYRQADFAPELFIGPRSKRPRPVVHKLPPNTQNVAGATSVHSVVYYQKSTPSDCVNPIDLPSTGPMSGNNQRMYAETKIVSVPTADTSGGVLLLHFDSRRYVFGQISEGTQRALHQRRVGLSKVDQIFITGPMNWSSVGGLFGLILTLADTIGSQATDKTAEKQDKKNKADPVAPTLRIHGGVNLAYMIATARKFIFRQHMPLRLNEIAHHPGTTDPDARKPDFEDSNIKVWYVSLLPRASNGLKRSHNVMDQDADDGECEREGEGESNKARNKGIVQSVIDHMFDTNWNMDGLVQSNLFKADPKATVFVMEEGEMQKYTGPMPGQHGCRDIPVFTRVGPWTGTQVSELPPTTPSKQAISYIVKAHDRRGKFKPDVAVELGVVKTDFKLLTAGQTVKGKDGMDVTPDMCVDPTIEGRAFAVIDLPDVSYVDAFLARPEWQYDTIMATMDAMYWNLGRGVVHDQRVQKFMKDHPRPRHTVFSLDVGPNRIVMDSSAKQSLKLHAVDPVRFPIPVFDNTVQYSSPDKTFHEARVLSKQLLAPYVLTTDTDVAFMMDASLNLHIGAHVTAMAKEAQNRSTDPALLAAIEAAEADIPNRDTEVIALGTGSSMPSGYRNVSATLVRIPGCGSYLFDAGESTLGQLRRMYGYEKSNEILADLKVIWISHLHADHHLGITSIIKAWKDSSAIKYSDSDKLPRLLVASGHSMLDWLAEYSLVEDFGHSRILPVRMKGHTRPGEVQEPFVLYPGLSDDTGGLERIDSVRVDHCYGSLACVFRWKSGLSVAYSGDCRPSRAFAQLAQGVTLLIHEATLDDELQGDAHVKKHCTMSEALMVARDMRARRVLLTHFSQRYPHIPNAVLVQSAAQRKEVKDQVVLLAFDQMAVKLGDFKKAELFLPAMRQLLGSWDEE